MESMDVLEIGSVSDLRWKGRNMFLFTWAH